MNLDKSLVRKKCTRKKKGLEENHPKIGVPVKNKGGNKQVKKVRSVLNATRGLTINIKNLEITFG